MSTLSLLGFAYVATVFFLAFTEVKTFPSYQNRIPNGHRVANPCNLSASWTSVGHQFSNSDGRLNRFGVDYLANGKTWLAVCPLDSDGDGKSNGEELGDPNCLWERASNVVLSEPIGHPGVCEPIGSPKCERYNSFLKKLPECSSITQTVTPPPRFEAPSWCPSLAFDRSARIATFQIDKTEIPAQEYHILCQQFPIIDDETYHILAWEPVLSNPSYIHHITVYACDEPNDLNRLTTIGGYLTPKKCGMSPACQSVIASWGTGSGSRCYSTNFGIPMGKSYYSTIILQIHYYNPKRARGITDNSGIKFYYSSKLKPNEIGVLFTGQERIRIPPQVTSTTVVGRAFSSKQCSVESLKGHNRYTVTGATFSMNRLGNHGRLSIIKGSNGEKIDIVDRSMKFERPTYLTLSEPNRYILEPGDNIEIECRYNSTSRYSWTFFGSTFQDEVCFASIEMYPKPNNELWQLVDSIGNIDQCLIGKDTIGPCSMQDFYATMNRIANSSGGGLEVHCTCQEYPAKMCTQSCYTFLTEWNLLNNPCVTASKGDVFLFSSWYWVLPYPKTAFEVYSQISTCLGLTSIPSADVKCSDSSVTSQSLAGTTWPPNSRTTTSTSTQQKQVVNTTTKQPKNSANDFVDLSISISIFLAIFHVNIIL